ncbi:MAG TPA: adenylyl-sulfate kinase, partial [Thermoanaerobaculia bacterium]|nr:adenylyl-sulfate kinase [Thermoanaerobaculia bacterium]
MGTRGAVVWLTGLSGSGKTTIASALAEKLAAAGYATYVLDGDRLRQGLNSDLGFSPEDRAENIRRAGEVAALFADAGVIAIAAFISPYREGRDKARLAAGAERFVEVFLDTPVEECERRD